MNSPAQLHLSNQGRYKTRIQWSSFRVTQFVEYTADCSLNFSLQINRWRKNIYFWGNSMLSLSKCDNMKKGTETAIVFVSCLPPARSLCIGKWKKKEFLHALFRLFQSFIIIFILFLKEFKAIVLCNVFQKWSYLRTNILHNVIVQLSVKKKLISVGVCASLCF